MSPTIVRNVRLDDTLWQGLQEIEDRDGVPVQEQIRRAVKAWLEAKGVQPQATRATRRRPKSS